MSTVRIKRVYPLGHGPTDEAHVFTFDKGMSQLARFTVHPEGEGWSVLQVPTTLGVDALTPEFVDEYLQAIRTGRFSHRAGSRFHGVVGEIRVDGTTHRFHLSNDQEREDFFDAVGRAQEQQEATQQWFATISTAGPHSTMLWLEKSAFSPRPSLSVTWPATTPWPVPLVGWVLSHHRDAAARNMDVSGFAATLSNVIKIAQASFGAVQTTPERPTPDAGAVGLC